MAQDRLNYYEILQVTPHAAPEVIKAAHRALSKTMHPDAGGSTALAVAINEAIDVLSDAAKRQRYDMELRIGQAKTFPSGTVETVIEREVFIAVCLSCGAKCRLRDTSLDGAKCGTCGGLFSSSVATPFIQRQEKGVPLLVVAGIGIFFSVMAFLSLKDVGPNLDAANARAIVAECRTGVVTSIGEPFAKFVRVGVKSDSGRDVTILITPRYFDVYGDVIQVSVGDRIEVSPRTSHHYSKADDTLEYHINDPKEFRAVVAKY